MTTATATDHCVRQMPTWMLGAASIALLWGCGRSLSRPRRDPT